MSDVIKNIPIGNLIHYCLPIKGSQSMLYLIIAKLEFTSMTTLGY